MQGGGGRLEHHCEGGEVKSDLLSRESKQRVTWNLSPFVFFDSEKTGGNLTCGPPITEILDDVGVEMITLCYR